MKMWAIMLRVLLNCNRFSLGDKGTRKFLKAVLLSMYGSAYSPHFRNARKSEIMKRFVTSKIIGRFSKRGIIKR